MDFEALDARMQWYVDQQILGCVATMVLDGTDIVHEQRHGFLSVEDGRPLTPDAIFRMYSNTKLVTSVALMMLYEEGRFGLDDPLAEYLPAFGQMRVLDADASGIGDTHAARQPIRIRHVLSHTAGLSYGFIEPNAVIDKGYTDAGITPLSVRAMTLEPLCDRLAELPLCYEPGQGWRYSFATDVCARLVEVLSGDTFDAFLERRIFGPLGMDDTDFYVPESKRDRFTTMYAAQDLMNPMEPGLPVADDPYTGAYTRKPAFLSGGGGLVSTMSDYATFVRMIINDGSWAGTTFLEPGTLRLMRESQLAPGVEVAFPMWKMPDTTFGLGFAVKMRPQQGEPAQAAGEYHWGGMAGTHSWFAPEANLTGMCFTQRMVGFWHPFSHEFRKHVYGAWSAAA